MSSLLQGRGHTEEQGRAAPLGWRYASRSRFKLLGVQTSIKTEREKVGGGDVASPGEGNTIERGVLLR